jgi:hypothetical protein
MSNNSKDKLSRIKNRKKKVNLKATAKMIKTRNSSKSNKKMSSNLQMLLSQSNRLRKSRNYKTTGGL